MFNKSQIMKRAWALMVEVYKLGTYKEATFAAIGRKCFAWCLKKAWAEAREAIRIAAIPNKAERIADLEAAIEGLAYLSFHIDASKRRAPLRAEINALRSAL